MSALLSVILPVYNQEKFLAETIESVLCQTYSDFELLILDDGSTDTSAGIIRKYASEDTRVKAYFNKNAGRSEASNFLVKKATGVYCALLDADDVMLSNRLEKQLQFHENNDIAASSCHCYYINEQGRQMGIQHYPFLETAEAWNIARQTGNLVHCAITGLMIKRTDYIASGGMNSKFWPCDDMEFINRLMDKNYRIIIMQEILMKYRFHVSSATSSSQGHMFYMMGFTGHCISLRRNHKPEISFADYMSLYKENTSWFTRTKIKMHQLAIIFHRKAGFNLYTKKYGMFIYQIIIASMMDYKYVSASLKNRRQFFKKRKIQ